VTTGTTFRDSGLAAGSSHTYRVRAFDAAGNRSDLSTASASVTTQTDTTNPPPTTGGAIAFRAASSANNGNGATTLSFTKPTGAVAGDVALMAVAWRGGATISTPAGWTLVRQDNNGTTVRQAIFRRVLTGTDSFSATLSTSTQAAGVVNVYSGVSTTTPVDVHGGQFNTGTAVTAPSITTTKANAQLVGFYASASLTAFTPPTGMTERGENVSPSTAAFKVTAESADQARSATGATGTRVATAGSTNPSVGQLVALAPAA
jgi:hypothetical protein